MTARTVREEHEQFLPELDAIRALADSVGRLSAESLLARSDAVHEFLAHRLMPHAVAEGRLMFPLVRKLEGGAASALSMNQCHVQLARLTDGLETVTDRIRKQGTKRGSENELRRVLYGLHVLLTAHFEQADEVLAAGLAGATPEERRQRFQDVGRTAREVARLYE